MLGPDRRSGRTSAVSVSPDDHIAIVGAACTYPGGCNDPAALWRLLRTGGSAIGPVPSDRWPIEAGSTARSGGFLIDPCPFSFDAAFFDISPAEAQAMDPQQRLLLEVGWRALETAGIAVEPATGLPIGVFVAIGTTDYQGARLWRPKHADTFTATGLSFAAAAGRLSYSFGLVGPSLAVDTACSSSLVAFHLACQAIRAGDCETALVAGVNALLAPNLFSCLETMSLLSPDGRCRPFDAEGNGYVRAEGCGAVVLKPLARARRDGDDILALCRGSAVNQDGRTGSLTAPSGLAQRRVIAKALARAHLAPDAIDYVEAHGTGTPLGDAVELEALAASYADGRDRRSPLLVGSIKANIGHLEAGAGMAGLIKAILCLRHGTIPPQPIRRRNPHLDWNAVALELPTALTPWPVERRPRRAGISSFGFGGTNAHVILEEAPPRPARGKRPAGAVVLPISARTPSALDRLAADLADWLDAEPRDLADVGYTLATGRTAFACRRAVVGTTSDDLAARLRGRASNDADPDPIVARLTEVAGIWAAGGSVDWTRLYRPTEVRVTTVPGHPFQRRVHRPEPSPSAAPEDPTTPTIAKPDGPAAWQRLIDTHARAVLSDASLASLDPEVPLVDQGFTSLLALELRRVLEQALGRPLPATLLYNYPSILRMAEMFAAPEGAPPSPPSPAEPDDAFEFLDTLSADELAALIENEVEAP